MRWCARTALSLTRIDVPGHPCHSCESRNPSCRHTGYTPSRHTGCIPRRHTGLVPVSSLITCRPWRLFVPLDSGIRRNDGYSGFPSFGPSTAHPCATAPSFGPSTAHPPAYSMQSLPRHAVSRGAGYVPLLCLRRNGTGGSFSFAPDLLIYNYQSVLIFQRSGGDRRDGQSQLLSFNTIGRTRGSERRVHHAGCKCAGIPAT